MHTKRYEGYQIEEDGISLHRDRVYVSYDPCSEVHNSVHITESNAHDRIRNYNHAKNCSEDRDEYFCHARLRRVVLDELHRVPYSTH